MFDLWFQIIMIVLMIIFLFFVMALIGVIHELKRISINLTLTTKTSDDDPADYWKHGGNTDDETNN